MLLLGLLMVNNSVRSGQDNVTELTGWEEIGGPFVDLKTYKNLIGRIQGLETLIVFFN